MNSLERSLILKAGYDNGWEVVVTDTPEQVEMASALHGASARVEASRPGCRWSIRFRPEALQGELRQSTPGYPLEAGAFAAADERAIGTLLSLAARLARSLPDAPNRRFDKVVAEQLAAIDPTTCTTEVERLVRQRVGQDVFRASLVDYWGGACAVTGIATPELLRASHAKAWADCTTDADRLNVFNGFLLVAHLDALFDRYLMTFDDAGVAVFSERVTEDLRKQLGLAPSIRLRWIHDRHRSFLAHHRRMFEQAA